ncbi:Isochorismatase hydrolase [Sistotremastrum niveocremeum HHB9708]|uniref:Isochorismatase hydrolase n=1 Tax=Sistotremastrum niveocremeum HHB9708 TaxID=1314777 RepID=A0A164ZHA2_9AGAM|nr:Isochorismatase hydrolase [Sistotremastrum niveocremeum HHB9708]
MTGHVQSIDPAHTILFICDMQEKFRQHIYGGDHVVGTVVKLLKVAKLFQFPVLATEQNPKSLGPTSQEILTQFKELGPLLLGVIPKTRFSMVTDEVLQVLKEHEHIKNVVLCGVESHICVVQSTIDLVNTGYNVHVIGDGVSSCNKEEVPIAFDRIRQVGGVITSSESLIYQLLDDATNPLFKAAAGIVREEKDATRERFQALF